MSSVDISVAAGSLATGVFAVSTLPMMVKARRTRDVRSYSLGNIVLGNVGNLLYTVYVLHLPMGPIWALHAFHTVTTGLMLYWYARFVLIPRRRRRRTRAALPSETIPAFQVTAIRATAPSPRSTALP
jgi:hypothetical protein